MVEGEEGRVRLVGQVRLVGLRGKAPDQPHPPNQP